jgi:outer membrane protein insertion porin family
MKRLVLIGCLVAATSLAWAQDAEEGEEPAATPTPNAPAGTAKIERIQFRGNRKVEDDAIRANLTTALGSTLDRQKLREDVRALWKMGFFEDIEVEAESGATGGLTVTFVFTEKPSIRRILVSGSDGLDLDKINEVVDLKRDSIVDVTKVKKNVEKIRELYVSKGYYLAAVDYQIRPVNESEVDVWLMVQENAKVKIRSVNFAGNKDIPDEELRQIISTKEGGYLGFLSDQGTFKEEDFERDLTLITAYYYDHGHINVKVGTPQIALSADKRYMYITIPIDEGPVYDIGKIDFKGDLMNAAGKDCDAATCKAAYYERLKTRPGDMFSRSKLGVDLVKLNDFYKDQGYAYVNVNPLTDVDPEKRLVNVTFEIERGAMVYFERINIRGNSKTRDKVIRREMKISEGQLFSNTDLEISRARIQALGFFESVNVSTKRGSSDEYIEVTIEVIERPTGTFQIGAGFSSGENFIAQAQISQNNLLGRGQTLSLQAQLSGLRQLFQLRFIEPYFFDSDWTFAFDIYNQVRYQETFGRTSTGGSLTWGYPLSYESRVFLTYRLENVGVTTSTRGIILAGAIASSTSPEYVANLFRGGILSSLRASISYDSRDNRLFTSKGFYNNAFFEVADKFTGSESTFIRYGGFARYYRPIIGPFVLKMNAEIGIITSRLPEGVAITERYLVGGINDIRGFRPRTLGPRLLVQAPGPPEALGTQALGGNMQLIWNSEIEFPLFKKVGISGVVFFDAGNAYNLEDRYCSREGEGVQLSAKIDPCFSFPRSITQGLRSSVGFGFRWFSPIGPLRFEWGLPLDRLPGEDPLVFEFTIGNFL